MTFVEGVPAANISGVLWNVNDFAVYNFTQPNVHEDQVAYRQFSRPSFPEKAQLREAMHIVTFARAKDLCATG